MFGISHSSDTKADHTLLWGSSSISDLKRLLQKSCVNNSLSLQFVIVCLLICSKRFLTTTSVRGTFRTFFCEEGHWYEILLSSNVNFMRGKKKSAWFFCYYYCKVDPCLFLLSFGNRLTLHFQSFSQKVSRALVLEEEEMYAQSETLVHKYVQVYTLLFLRSCLCEKHHIQCRGVHL